jgi:sensor c-di-GMP phosphodiesterase-like protein
VQPAPIVEAIIALARKLKLEIVAEAVEQEAQRGFLNGGCSRCKVSCWSVAEGKFVCKS